MKFKLTTVFVLTTSLFISLLVWFMLTDEAAIKNLNVDQTQRGDQPVINIQQQQPNAKGEDKTIQLTPLNHTTDQAFNESSIEGSLHGSLNGSLPDGAVNITVNGDVQIDTDLHRLFDYYLSLTGEKSIQAIRSLMFNTVGNTLSPDQLAQLQDHFDRYLDYLTTAQDYASTNLNTKDGLAQLNAISQLRRQLLGEDMAQAFFGEEEAYARHMIQMQLTGTSEASEEQQIKWFNNEDQATAYHDVLIENQQFNDSGINDTDRMDIRTATYGEAVAQQLAELDHTQQQWQTTVNHYIETRSRLQNNPTALNQFEQSYSLTELKRLQAYYRAHLLTETSP